MFSFLVVSAIVKTMTRRMAELLQYSFRRLSPHLVKLDRKNGDYEVPGVAFYEPAFFST